MKKIMSTKLIIVAIFGSIFIVIIIFTIVIACNIKVSKIISNEKNIKLDKSSAIEGTVKTAKKIEEIDHGYVVKIGKGQIKWQEPEDLGDIGLTSKSIYDGCSDTCPKQSEGIISDGVKYVKVGEITDGTFKNMELITVISFIYDTGPSYGPNIFRILRNNKAIDFIVDERDGSQFFTEHRSQKEIIKTFFNNTKKVAKIYNDIAIEELIYPEEIQGENNRQILIKNKHDRMFFTDKLLKPVFVHKKYGQIWMSDEAKVAKYFSDKKNINDLELNSYLKYGVKKYWNRTYKRGFYIKAPDGTLISYRLKLDIFDKKNYDDSVGILQATWNNGRKNVKIYEERLPNDSDYVYEERFERNISKDELKIIGKTNQGDELYGYKDIESKDFNYFYDNLYFVKEGSKFKKNKKEFLKMHPKVFWEDPFGRLLSFYRLDLVHRL